MRTALWETSAGALVALLNSRVPLTKVDLYTVTLLDGTTYRWSGADVAVRGNSQLWTLGPGLKRTRVRWVVGIEVDTLTITVTDNLGTLVNGRGLLAAINAGVFQGARVQLDRAFWGPGATAPVGALLWFTGRVSEVPYCDRYEARLAVKSDLELLNVQVPRDVYQAGCLNTLYEPSTCGISRAGLTVTGAATSATSAARTTFSHALAQAAGWFSLGVITMTSGANAGVSRTVKQHTAGQLVALQPWPFAVASGDTFAIVPGCDKTLTTCTAKFSNRARFRGQPFVPVPETVS